MSGETFYLERASEDDLDALLALERQSFTHPWTPRHFRDALASPDRILTLVLRSPCQPGEEERGIRAYCVVETVADEMHIHDLAVHPGHRRQGLGSKLLALVLEIAAQRGAETAFLEVRRSNWPALALYRSQGFEAITVRRDYYARPQEDALVLRRSGLRSGSSEVSGNP